MRKVTATLTATALLASLAVGLAINTKRGAFPPVQQRWGRGTAAGLRHRAPASQTKALSVPVAGTNGVGPASGPQHASRLPRGAVPRTGRPHPLKLPARGHAAQTLRQQASPALRPVSGFNPRTSQAVAAGRGANRVVYQNADGTKTAFLYQDPVNRRLPNGSWVPIDDRLAAAAASGPGAAATAPVSASRVPPSELFSPSPVPELPSSSPSPAGSGSPPASAPSGAPAGWAERSAAEPVRFASYADVSRLVWLPLARSRGVGFGLASASRVAGQVSGTTVTYPGVRPGADLRFTAGTGEVEEQIILRSAAAPETWVFPLDLRGLRAVAGTHGAIQFVTAAGKVAAVVPPGSMTDSNVDPRSGDGATSAGVSYSLISADGRPAIRMTLDSAWLRSPGRVFPVTVDPTVSSVDSNGTTYVMSSSTGDFSGGTEIKAGTWDGGSDIAKSFLKFDSVSSSLKNDTVLGAELGLFNSWSYSCSPRTVYVYPVTSSWPVTGSKSWPGPSTGAAVGRASFATGWVPLGSTHSPCPSKWENIGLDQAATNLINGWTHNQSSNNGLAVGASASDSYGWKKFTSDNVTNGAPFLAVTYTPDGASYKLASTRPVVPVEFNQNGEIAIKVTNTGSSTWTPTNGFELSYTAFDSKGKQVGAAHPVFTPMPSTVGPGQSVVVDAKVNELPVGSYALDFTMYSGATGSSPVSFTSQYIPGLAVGLYVPQPPPVVTNVYPPTGYISPTSTPQLAVTAISLTGTSITYDFTVTCAPLPGETCPATAPSSGNISKPYWTPPPLQWNTPYRWSVKATNGTTSTTVGPVTITPEVPQPDVTTHLGGTGAQAFDPQTGDFTTSATDAAVAVPGPPLSIGRTYNSLSPASGAAFGTGWSSVADMAVTADNDGSNNVVVTMADGSQQRYGCNWNGSTCVSPYAAPMGSPDALVRASDGSWSLMDTSGTRYDFIPAGQISKITDADGLTQTFGYSSGQLATITDTSSGRALHLTWSTPSGATAAHVASVTTGPPAAGQSGLTWTYSYSGDQLAKVCAPAGGCTSYSYAATGSHYPTAVLDSAPRSYYRLGDPSGSAKASDSVDTNLGTTDGTYSNVTLGGAGPLAGGATSAAFNGTSSSVTLPARLISDSTNVSIELWFKTSSTTAGGVLFAYQADPLSSSTGNSDRHVPALYVGGNGKLYGELWNGKVDPIVSAGSVADDQWHHVVLTAAGSSQSLWLDGVEVGSVPGQIDQLNMNDDFVGAGFWQGGWPSAYQTEGPTLLNTPIGYFSGSIAEVAVYPHALGQPAITGHHAFGVAAASELTQVTMPSGRVLQQVSYDTTADRVSGYTDPNGGQWTIHLPITTGYMQNSESLSQASRSVTVVDPAGYQEVYTYDALNGGRLVSYDRGNGDPPRAFCYDGAGFLSSVSDEDGNMVSYTNDIHGNVLSRTWYPIQPASSGGCGGSAPPTGSGSSCTATGAACTTWYGYYYNPANPLDPRNDKLTAVRDARSASAADNTYLTSYSYNAAGQLTSSTTPATSDFPSGRTTSYTYSNGSQTAFGGAGTVPAGLLLTTTTPGGAVTSNSYDANGDLAQVTEPSGRHTTYTYDGLGRPLTSTLYTSSNTGGLTTSYSYNAMGQPLTVTHPPVTDVVSTVTHTLRDSYSYDADGDLTALTQSDTTGGDPTRTTSYTYDDHGQVATMTDPAGATSGGGSQSQGSSSPDPAGATTGYSYDGSGNVRQVVDPNGTTYRYTYNEYNEVTQVTMYAPASSQASPVANCAAPATQDADGGCDLVIESDSYDPAGLLAAQTDAIGRTTNYFYFFDQSLAQIEQQPATGQGRLTSYTYDPAGNLASQSITALANGSATGPATVTGYTYDAANRLTSQVLDPVPAGTSASGYVNRTTSYTYNADGYLTSQTRTDGSASQATSYGYDTAGNRTSQTVRDGSTNLVTTWTYDQNGEPVSMTDPRGNATGGTPASYTTNYTYDAAGDLATVTGPPVPVQTYTAQAPVTTRPVTSYGYDTFGDQTETVDPDNNLTTKTYDGDGRVLTVTQPSYTPPGATGPVTATTAFSYDEAGNLASVTDPAGNTTSYAYDALGDLISQTDPQLTGQPAAGVTAYTYDAAGERLSVTSPTGANTSYTYDYFGNQLTSTDALRQTTSSSYDDLGDPTQVTSPAGVVTKLAYDHVGELTSSTDAAGDKTSYAYNYLGQFAQLTRPDQTTQTYAYDGAGNVTSVTSYGTAPAPQTPPVLRTQGFAYDGAGNVTSATDGRGNSTSYTYTAANQLTTQVQPVSGTASITSTYGYDAAGNQTSVTDGNGNTTWTTYNSWDLPESVIEPSTPAYPAATDRTWKTGYDADGRPVAVTEPGGVTVTDGYDQLGDLTSQSGSGAGAATAPRSFSYDTDGRMVSASAPGGTDSFSYNADGQLTSASGPSGSSSLRYNPDGQLSSSTDAAGTTSYTYDTVGRLSTLTDPITGTTASYTYTPDSQVSQIGYGTGNDVRSYRYDQLGQLTSDTLTAGGAPVASIAYGYDGNGNVTSKTTSGFAGSAGNSYSYDKADRLTSWNNGATTTGYSYDPAGNLTQAGSTVNTYNARDQLTSSTTGSAATTFGYTASGTLSSQTSGSGTVFATTDAFGQPATEGGQSYSYDALGRLTGDSGPGGSYSLAYLGTGSQVATDGKSAYSYAPSGQLAAMGAVGGSTSQGQLAYTDLHTDVVGGFAPAGGPLSQSASYGPWGNLTATSGSRPSAGYQSGFTDPATGQVRMGARWYQPSTGTFTTGDTTSAGMPMPASVSPNSYGYADGDPMSAIDPTGHECYYVSTGFGRVSVCTPGPAGGGGSRGGIGLGGFRWPVSQGFQGSLSQVGMYQASQAMARIYEQQQQYYYQQRYQQQQARRRGGYGGGYAGGYYGGGYAGGYGGGYGRGGCAYGCYGPPKPPPPPPPPPQDCYAGPDPSCAPVPPPAALKTMPHITVPRPQAITLPSQIPGQRRVISPVPTEQQLLAELKLQTRGLTQQQNENGAAPERTETECDLTSTLANAAGKPGTPQPQGPGSGQNRRQPGAGGPSAPSCGDGLSELQKAIVNGLTGAATNLVGDLVHGVRDPQALIEDAIIGAASNIAAGAIADKLSEFPFVSADVAGEDVAQSINETIGSVIAGEIGNGLNSLGTQLAANDGDPSKVNMATVLIEELIGGLVGAVDPLAKQSGLAPGDSARAEKLRAYLAFSVGADYAACDPGLIPQGKNPCGP